MGPRLLKTSELLQQTTQVAGAQLPPVSGWLLSPRSLGLLQDSGQARPGCQRGRAV